MFNPITAHLHAPPIPAQQCLYEHCSPIKCVPPYSCLPRLNKTLDWWGLVPGIAVQAWCNNNICVLHTGSRSHSLYFLWQNNWESGTLEYMHSMYAYLDHKICEKCWKNGLVYVTCKFTVFFTGQLRRGTKYLSCVVILKKNGRHTVLYNKII